VMRFFKTILPFPNSHAGYTVTSYSNVKSNSMSSPGSPPSPKLRRALEFAGRVEALA